MKVARMKKTAKSKVKKVVKRTKSAKKLTVKKATKPVTVSKSVIPNSTQRVELWMYDEYNQGSIISSGSQLDKIIDKAKQFVTEQNVDNALASGEKHLAWEAYFPQFFDGKNIDYTMLYAGNKKDGKHYAYSFKNGKWEIGVVPKGYKVRFYMGKINDGQQSKDWYLTNHLNKEITSLDDQLLERKTVIFVKIP